MRKTNILIGLIVIIIIIILTGFYVATKKNNSGTLTATSTPNTPAFPQATNTPVVQTPSPIDPYPGWRTFLSPNLGITFRHPPEYLLKSEGYNVAGTYTARFGGDKGDIYLTVGKTLQDPGTRLQSTSIKVGGKDALSFNSRRDTCDINTARMALDANYSLQLQFESCGTTTNALFNDKALIAKILSSLQFTNANTALYVHTTLGISFRYPITNTPVEKKTSTSTILTMGKDLMVSEGKDRPLASIIDDLKKQPNTNVEAVYVDGIEAYRVIVTPRSGAPLRSIYLMHKGNLLTVRSSAVDANEFNTVANSLRILTK